MSQSFISTYVLCFRVTVTKELQTKESLIYRYFNILLHIEKILMKKTLQSTVVLSPSINSSHNNILACVKLTIYMLKSDKSLTINFKITYRSCSFLLIVFQRIHKLIFTWIIPLFDKYMHIWMVFVLQCFFIDQIITESDLFIFLRSEIKRKSLIKIINACKNH